MTTPRTAHVATASINQTVGDWSGNGRRLISVLEAARRGGVRLLALPELAISGYSLGDRVLRRGTLENSWNTLLSVVPHTTGLVTFLGLPICHRGVLYNAVAVVADGQLVGFTAKENLATGDVEYENRWYAGWPRGEVDSFEAPDGTNWPIGSLLFDVPGLGRVAVEVCEDAWKGMRPGSIAALAGATILVNPSASWFVLGKQEVRRKMISQISQEDLAVYVFSSLLGCDDTRLIFDGSAMIAQEGEIIAEAPRFRFSSEFEMVDRVVDLDALRLKRMATGSWRQQVEALHRGDFGPIPEIIAIEGSFTTTRPAPPSLPYWTRGTRQQPVEPSLAWIVDEGLAPSFSPTDIPHVELELALCLALREYLRKTGVKGVTLALSGGRDSTMCALLIHRMHRYDQPRLTNDELRAYTAEHFTTVWMETENSSENTRRAAQTVAAEIGARHLSCSVQEAFDLNLRIARQLTGEEIGWQNPRHDIPMQNIQARIRGSLVWMVANLENYLLITTSNLSEAAVGYTTMDGDTAGGLAPIANVPKSLISIWLRWAAGFHDYRSVEQVFEAPATAELRPPACTQTDEDDLMPFFILDQLIYLFVQRGKDPIEMFETLWPELQHHYRGEAKAFATHIRTFVRRLCAAQWKRERFAISFRVTAFDLDPKTGFRFPPVQAPFTEELAQLDAHVARLLI